MHREYNTPTLIMDVVLIFFLNMNNKEQYRMEKTSKIEKNASETLYLNFIVSFNHKYIKKLLKENKMYNNILYLIGKRVIILLSFLGEVNLFSINGVVGKIFFRILDAFLLVNFCLVKFNFLSIVRAFL